MKHVIRNLSLNVEEKGSGDISLVFLHYWGGTHRTWNKVVSQLEDSFGSVATFRRRQIIACPARMFRLLNRRDGR
jgi:hypothetical protein